ncbi:MAG: hypothetical protein ACREQV_25070 [Candidatus Binatia bacterium]
MKAAATILVAVMLTGCIPRSYSLRIENQSPDNLRDVTVKYSGQSSMSWDLANGQKQTELGFGARIEGPAVVRWSMNSDTAERVVDLARIPPEFDYRRDGIVFVIRNDKAVQVLYEIWDRKGAPRVIAGKTSFPSKQDKTF